MRRRTAPVLLAVLLLVPTIPARAGEPQVAPPVETAPSTEPAPSAEPSVDASPATDPMPAPSAEPSPAAEPSTPAASLEPTAPPVVEPAPAATDAALPDPVPSSAADPAGRWIVVMKPGQAAKPVADRHARADGVKADRVFGSVGAFSARLTTQQRRDLAADPAVLAVVPDERIEVASQTIPTGVRRIGTRSSAMAAINGVDQRVDADVAIVDTGIDASHPDLNVAGGYNCSTSDRTAWRDVNGHGTHVAGTVAARDDAYGVVGVAPGARLWAVKILDDTGSGLLSWYVCGLDWIAAQRDPNDAGRPLIEAVNMSVTKWGRDDGDCGATNADVLHQAICRVVAKNITVVAAAANDAGSAALRVPAAYDEVITVSALADTDGLAGGLGGPRCWSWGGYDQDDTFADFSNYGSDVDLIAPGKCIYSTLPGNRYGYSSGTSMAAPHVTGAVALYKATRPWATPAEVKEALQYLGNYDWATSTDPDGRPDKLLQVGRIGAYGDFSVSLGGVASPMNEAGGSQAIPFTLARTTTSFERVALSVSAAGGVAASLDRTGSYGFGNLTGTLTITVPPSTPAGSYPVTVSASEHGRVRQVTTSVVVENDIPTASPPSSSLRAGIRLAASGSSPARVSWPAATDPTSAITAYQVDVSIDGKAWATVATTAGSTRSLDRVVVPGHVYVFRLRARDAAGNWSDWATGARMKVGIIQDTSRSLRYSTGWARQWLSAAYGGTLTYASRGGSSVRLSVLARQVGLVVRATPYRGAVRVYVDGTLVATVSTYARTTESRKIVWVGSWATVATRTIDLRVVGTSGRPRVDVDGFLTVQ